MTAFLQATWPILAVLGGMSLLFIVLRNRPTPIDTLDEIVGHGRPAVIEIFSNT